MVKEFNRCVTEIVGAYWGDEGKGRAAAYEAQDARFVLRTTGGNNAGHTVYYKGNKIPLHLVPGGIVYNNVTAIICAGVVINPKILHEEIQSLSKYINVSSEKLMISDCATIILPFHVDLDLIQENMRGNSKIGTTKTGNGPVHSSRANRVGIRMLDLFRTEQDLKNLLKVELEFDRRNLESYGVFYTVDSLYEFCMEAKKNLGGYVKDVNPVIKDALQYGDKIVIEGAQADHLDLLHGDLRDVSSSQCNSSGTLSGAGIGPLYVNKVIATMKTYCSRVGNGIFPTELKNEEGDIIRELGHEYGTTTGRPRRCGWLDLVALNSVTRSYSDICLNHLDTIGLIGEKLGYIKVCTSYTYLGIKIHYFPKDTEITGETPKPNYEVFEGGWNIPKGCKTFEDLPEKAQKFVLFIEEQTNIPVSYIGIGPNNEDTIIR